MSNIDRPSVGIIGLGIMGGLMAKTLIENGFKVFGRDIEPACNQRLRRAGGQVLKPNALVAVHADVLMISVASSAALSSVMSDLAQTPRPAKAQIVIDTSTLPLTDKMAAARELKRQIGRAHV